jgi:AcrR family transcriptional regulator
MPKVEKTAPRGEAAERILRVAMHLFAGKGYERTTVADIQRAAGLAPGSGALYKHFASKEAILRAGIDRFVSNSSNTERLLRTAPRASVPALAMLAEAALARLVDDIDTIRIVWRELDHFPDLKAKAVRGRIQAAYSKLGAWIGDRAASGEIVVGDPQATAVVLLASVVMFRVFDALMGETPGRISRGRFLKAWMEVAVRGISPSGTPAAASDHTRKRKAARRAAGIR